MLAMCRDEEMGGMLLAVREVDSIDQAVQEANDSAFGLGTSVWCKRLKEGEGIARWLEAGMVWINDTSVGLPEFPWGGMKGSGWGRLFSREAIQEMTQTKVISGESVRRSKRKVWWFPSSEAKFRTFLSLNELSYGASGWRRVSALTRFMGAYLSLRSRKGHR